MTTKKFYLEAKDIESLAEGMGGCIATDRITVDGEKIRFMYREEPDTDLDSGWRFMAGDEDNEYLDDPENHGVYDVNTIANYDRDIIPHLKAPVGSSFERETEDAEFVAIDFEPDEE